MSNQSDNQMDRMLLRALIKLAKTRQDDGLIYVNAMGLATGTLGAPGIPGHYLEVNFDEPIVADASFELVMTADELAAATRLRQSRLAVTASEDSDDVEINGVKLSALESQDRLSEHPNPPRPTASVKPRLRVMVDQTFRDAVARAFPATDADNPSFKKYTSGVAVDLVRSRVMATDNNRLHLVTSATASDPAVKVIGLEGDALMAHEAIMLIHVAAAQLLPLGAVDIEWHPSSSPSDEKARSSLMIMRGSTPTGVSWMWTTECDSAPQYPDVDRIIPARVNGAVVVLGASDENLEQQPLVVQFPSCVKELREWVAQCKRLTGPRSQLPPVVLDPVHGLLRAGPDASVQFRLPIESIQTAKLTEVPADGAARNWPVMAVDPVYLADAIEHLQPNTRWDVNVPPGLWVATDQNGMTAILQQKLNPS